MLNALTVLQPSTVLNDLLVLLFAIEDRAKLYYISGGKTSGGKTSGGDTPTPEPTPSPDGGDTPTPEPEPEPEPTPVTPE